MQHADGFTAILMAAFATLILAFLWRARRGRVAYVRPIPGIASLEEAVGRATELGRPVIFVMGGSDIRDIQTHAALSVLSHVARLAARLRTPFLTLVKVANVFPFAEEVLREAYKAEGLLDQFSADQQVRFLSQDSIVYAMSAGRTIEETRAGCAIFYGTFDFTSLLMAEPGAQMGIIQIAGDPGLAQIPFFVCTCDYTIIGEEYFAAGAYLSRDPTMRGTLVSQDLIKVLLAGLVLLGTVCAQFAHPWAQAVVEFFMRYKR